MTREGLLKVFELLFEHHERKCEVAIYSPLACEILDFLKDLGLFEFFYLLDVLPKLSGTHQEMAISCISNFRCLSRAVLIKIAWFCTLDKALSQVIFPLVERVFLCYEMKGIKNDDMKMFLLDLLGNFPSSYNILASETSVEDMIKEAILDDLSDQVGCTIVDKLNEESSSDLCTNLLKLFAENEGPKLLLKRGAILKVVARVMKEKKISVNVNAFLSRLSISLREHFYLVGSTIVDKLNEEDQRKSFMNKFHKDGNLL